MMNKHTIGLLAFIFSFSTHAMEENAKLNYLGSVLDFTKAFFDKSFKIAIYNDGRSISYPKYYSNTENSYALMSEPTFVKMFTHVQGMSESAQSAFIDLPEKSQGQQLLADFYKFNNNLDLPQELPVVLWSVVVVDPPATELERKLAIGLNSFAATKKISVHELWEKLRKEILKNRADLHEAIRSESAAQIEHSFKQIIFLKDILK